MGTKAQMELLLKESTTISKKANENFELLLDISRTNENKLEVIMKEIDKLPEEVKDLQSNISPKVASVKEQVEDIRNIANDISTHSHKHGLMLQVLLHLMHKM